MSKNKGKQFNIERRRNLFFLLSKGKSAKEIAESINMDPTSVSREIKRNRILTKEAKVEASICASCEHRKWCKIKHVCDLMTCQGHCVDCKKVVTCWKYKKMECNKTKRFPFVCNNCVNEVMCPYEHYKYSFIDANEKAVKRQVETREGANLTREELENHDRILYDAIVKNGQSVHHALVANMDQFKCSEKTIYRRIDKGVYVVRNHDLPRKVTLKKRKVLKEKYDYKHDDKLNRKGHLYSDWLVFQMKNNLTHHVQMDFLGATRDSFKEILSLTIVGMQFIILYIIERPDQEKVIELFGKIEEEIGLENFKKLFPAILTDRDVKFDDIQGIEYDKNGELRTRLFFCNPAASNQKANIENVNGQMRQVFPKKKNINDYTQEDIYFVASNLNARFLSSIDDKTPSSLFIEIFGENLFKLLHLKTIDPKKVQLKPIH